MALSLGDSSLLTQVGIRDVVANELKYHGKCLINYRRKFTEIEQNKVCDVDRDVDSERLAIEELIGIIDEEISEGKSIFPLIELYEK